jgi:hypothetical protein
LAGLVPAIYVFRRFGDLGGQDVDARNKSGQGVFAVAPWLIPFDPTLSQLLNRTTVGQARPRRSYSADFLSCFAPAPRGWLFLQRINSHRHLVFRGNPRPPMVRRSEK